MLRLLVMFLLKIMVYFGRCPVNCSDEINSNIDTLSTRAKLVNSINLSHGNLCNRLNEHDQAEKLKKKLKKNTKKACTPCFFQEENLKFTNNKKMRYDKESDFFNNSSTLSTRRSGFESQYCDSDFAINVKYDENQSSTVQKSEASLNPDSSKLVEQKKDLYRKEVADKKYFECSQTKEFKSPTFVDNYLNNMVSDLTNKSKDLIDPSLNDYSDNLETSKITNLRFSHLSNTVQRNNADNSCFTKDDKTTGQTQNVQSLVVLFFKPESIKNLVEKGNETIYTFLAKENVKIQGFFDRSPITTQSNYNEYLGKATPPKIDNLLHLIRFYWLNIEQFFQFFLIFSAPNNLRLYEYLIELRTYLQNKYQDKNTEITTTAYLIEEIKFIISQPELKKLKVFLPELYSLECNFDILNIYLEEKAITAYVILFQMCLYISKSLPSEYFEAREIFKQVKTQMENPYFANDVLNLSVLFYSFLYNITTSVHQLQFYKFIITEQIMITKRFNNKMVVEDDIYDVYFMKKILYFDILKQSRYFSATFEFDLNVKENVDFVLIFEQKKSEVDSQIMLRKHFLSFKTARNFYELKSKYNYISELLLRIEIWSKAKISCNYKIFSKTNLKITYLLVLENDHEYSFDGVKFQSKKMLLACFD